MPASLKRFGDVLAPMGLCEACNAPANFGIEMNLRRALEFLDKGDKVRAKQELGSWFCITHMKEQAAWRGRK